MFIPQIPERKQLSIPKIESPEGYYEEAEPYDTSLNGTPRGQGWGSEGVQLLPAQMPALEATERWATTLVGGAGTSQWTRAARKEAGMVRSEWFPVSDAFGVSVRMVLASAQKCDGGEVCGSRDTCKQWEHGQAEPEGSLVGLTVNCAHAVCQECF